MSYINKLLLNSKLQNNQDQQTIINKRSPINKKRNQSLQVIFRFPKSLLKRIQQEEVYGIKKQRSFNIKVQQKIQLGDIGTIYHNNLMNNRGNLFLQTNRKKKDNDSFGQHYYSEARKKKQSINNQETISNTQYNPKIVETLNLIQKNLVQESYKYNQNDFQLHASRLPIIRKHRNRRKQIIQEFGQKYYPIPTPSPLNLIRPQIEFHTITVGLPPQKKKKQKPEIRGWDIPDFD